ncbi:hypothetical protein CR513_15200, partial [Mucuna pruriens]
LSAEDQIHQSVLGIPINPFQQTSASQSQTCISSIERNTNVTPCTTVGGEKRERRNGYNERDISADPARIEELAKSPRLSQSDSVASIQNQVSLTLLYPSLRLLRATTLVHSDTSIIPNSSDLDNSTPNSNEERNQLHIDAMMYQPWCPQYPKWDGAWSYDNYQSELTAVLLKLYQFASNSHHFDNRGSTTSRGMNGIVIADNKRFEGYIDGCGMCGSIGHPPNDCPILQEPPPPFGLQPVQESSLEDLIKQFSMNNIQFQKNVFARQQPVHQLNNSPSLKDLVQQFQQNNMQFLQNINATMQELKAQIGQLATMINQLQFEDSGQVPSQAILTPQENMSDITVRSGMELPQQQSLKV